MEREPIKKQDNKSKYAIATILILGFVLSVAIAYKPFFDPDSFWHIKTGEYIFTNQKIPVNDIFSWYGEEHGLKWINHEWLFDLGIYIIYKMGGFFLVNFATAVFSGLLFILIYKFTVIRSNNKFLSVGVSLLGVLFDYAYLSPRPQIISYNLLLVLAILLEKKMWFWSIPLIIIGSNIHGGFYPMYILLITFYCLREKPIIILLSLLSIMANPYIADIYLFPFKIQQYGAFKIIQEWNATQLISKENLIDFGVYLILLFLVFNTKIKLKDAVFTLLIVVQTLSARRHMIFLYLLIIPILSPYINEKLQGIAVKLRAKQVNGYRVLIITMSILSIVFLIKAANTPLLDTSDYPVKAIAYIKANRIERVLNQFDDGGYLIFNDIKPAIDGRADIFAPIYNKDNFFAEFSNVMTLKEDYQSLLNRNQIKYLLINNKTIMYQVLKHDNNFKQLYVDDKYTIFLKS